MTETNDRNFVARGMKFGIVVSRFNEFITKRLLEGCLEALRKHGASDSDLEVAWVPGAFEIPLTAQKMAQSKRFDAIITLGCIIRGETSHNEVLAQEVVRGISEVALDAGIPVTLGVITADSLEQAADRSGAKRGNRGAEAALSAVEMVKVIQNLENRTEAR